MSDKDHPFQQPESTGKARRRFRLASFLGWACLMATVFVVMAIWVSEGVAAAAVLAIFVLSTYGICSLKNNPRNKQYF